MKLFKSAAALFLALCLLLSACADPTAPKPGYDPEQPTDVNAIEDVCLYSMGLSSQDVVATANGKNITAGELLIWLVTTVDNTASYFQQTGTGVDFWEIEPEEGKPMAQFLLDDALRLSASRIVIQEQAAAHGIVITDEQRTQIDEVLASLPEFAQSQNLTVDQLLGYYGMNQQLYRESCERDLFYDALSEKLYGDADESDILNYLTDQGMYRAQHILLANTDKNTGDPLDDEELQQRAQLAEDLLSQIRASDDPAATFRALMEEYTDDPGYLAQPDGYLATRGQMVEEFEDTALSLEEGEISEVVPSVYGYHIIMRCPLGIDPEEYRDSFVSDQMSTRLDGWLDEATIKPARVVSLLDVKTMYEAMTAYRDALSEIASGESAEEQTSDASAPDASAPDASAPDTSAPAAN